MKNKQTKIKPSKSTVKKKPVSKTATQKTKKTKKTKIDSCCSNSLSQSSNKFFLWWETFKKYFKI